MDKEIMDCNPPEAVLTVSTQSNTCRSPQEIAAEINAIRRRAARQLLEDSVEVGRLLVEAKSTVGHGEWGGWLEENFQYSSTEANNLMRLFEAYGTKEQLSLFEENRMDLFGRMNKSQAIALLGLPESERAAFVEANPPEDLSVREWERKIEEARRQAYAEAQDEWDALVKKREAEVDDAVKKVFLAQSEAADAKKAAREAADKLAEASARAESAENEAAEAKKLKKDLKAAQKLAEDRAKSNQNTLREMADLREEKDALQTRLDELEKTPVVEVREMTEEERAALEDRIRAEIGTETDALKAENEKLKLAADPGMQAFQRYFENFRGAYVGMKGIIDQSGEEKQKKLIDVVRKVLAAMAEEWS